MERVMINLHTKFEVSMFTHYEDIKGSENGEIWVIWGLGITKGDWHCHHSIERIRLPIRL